MKRKLGLMIMAALGFQTACEEKRTVDMYGVPEPYNCHIELSGRVTDIDGNPIGGIAVTFDNERTTTLAYGTYKVSRRTENFGYNTLYFDDIDGEANGGTFRSAHTNVSFKWSDHIADGNEEDKNLSFVREDVDITLAREE